MAMELRGSRAARQMAGAGDEDKRAFIIHGFGHSGESAHRPRLGCGAPRSDQSPDDSFGGAEVARAELPSGSPAARPMAVEPYPAFKLLLDKFSSDEIAVMICAGAKGFCTRMLFGTPREAQSSTKKPVM